MRTTCWILLLALSAASCSEAPEPIARPEAKTIRVEVGSGPRLNIASRTALDPDGTTIRWAAGDKIALWAVDQNGTPQLAAHPFSLWHYNDDYNQAKFTADIPEMAEGSYTYCAVAPVPDATEGTRASFDIPAVQDGTFNGAHDICVAAPVAGGALQPGDNSEAVTLAFTHKMHLLRIEIPVNKMNLPITRLTLTFPVEVTGRLTVDAADPAAAPELTEGDNVVTLAFAQPKDAGDVVYAMIAPTALTAADEITIKAYTESKESFPAVMHGKDYLAGHTTPISLTIPEMYRVTRIFFSLAGRGGRTDLAEDLAGGYGCSTLGERVNAFTLTAPDGVDLGNGTNTRTFTVNDENLYELSYEGVFNDNLSGQQFSVAFDSDNAIVTRQFTMPQLTADGRNAVDAFAVPYLLEENFDTVAEFSSGEAVTGINDPAAIWLPGLSDWSAARAGGQAGKCVRIVGHREGAWTAANYEARMDSPAIAGLKNEVKIRVSFDFSGSTNQGSPYLKYGTSTITGLVNGANDTIENEVGNFALSTYNSALNGSYDHVPFTFTYETQCRNGERITWVAYNYVDKVSSNPFKISYFFYYVYIDNVKVSIVR